jgi:hypothetical protein
MKINLWNLRNICVIFAIEHRKHKIGNAIHEETCENTRYNRERSNMLWQQTVGFIYNTLNFLAQ